MKSLNLYPFSQPTVLFETYANVCYCIYNKQQKKKILSMSEC